MNSCRNVPAEGQAILFPDRSVPKRTLCKVGAPAGSQNGDWTAWEEVRGPPSSQARRGRPLPRPKGACLPGGGTLSLPRATLVTETPLQLRWNRAVDTPMKMFVIEWTGQWQSLSSVPTTS